MKKLIVLVSIASLVILLFSQYTAQATVKVTHSIHYGADAQQIVDVYQPAGGAALSRPVVLWVHGGGWSIGDMQHGKGIEMMNTWAEQGIVVVGVNYRLAPTYMHPAQVQDVAAAINWVYQNIDKFGGDNTHISLLGHSAGAHLVALVATNPSYLTAYNLVPSQVLKNVFPIDTASFDLTNASRFVDKKIQDAFGRDDAVLKEASPIWNVHKGGNYPPFIIAATKVRNDAVTSSKILQQELKESGSSAKLIIVDYPNQSQLKAHMMISSELANLNSEMTHTLINQVLAK